MRRRELLAGAGALAITSCSQEENLNTKSLSKQRFNWKMVTTWPPNFPGMGTGVARLVEHIDKASAGRLKITTYAAGELVPAFEVFDTVSRGTAEMGHGAAYYWKGKSEAAQFFTAIPFGMNVLEMNGWLYYGGGLELYRELYDEFNLVPFLAGNTGVQMGGWFNREINSLKDLKGLKMRIPGIGGEALKRAGGSPVTLPGAEIFTALKTGTIDATEWVGPYNDMIMGLNEAAKYYYYPGWQEPGPMLECIINKDALNSLPEDLKTIVEIACAALNDQMTAEFSARNAEYLALLDQDENINIREFPRQVIQQLRSLTDDLLIELIERDPRAKKIHQSFIAYQKRAIRWSAISEQAYLNTRDF
ncbi:MAG: TRAP transporter substrate-binding protein [Pseudomonadota bacterium]|nr:TRAP transporter substrate-binding protein [Pseudomonadota bacterium]